MLKMARRIRRVALTEESKLVVIRLLALLAVLIGVLATYSSPEAGWLAFLIALYPLVLALLFPRISDQALAIPIWSFWLLSITLLLMGHPEDFPPPHIEARGISFIVCLTAFVAASIVAALEIRSSRWGKPYHSKRAFEMTAPAWAAALSPLGIALLLLLVEIVREMLRQNF